MDGQPPQDGHPSFKGSVLQTKNLALGLSFQNQNQVKFRMVSPHLQDGYQPSKGWSPIIPNLPEGSVLQAWNFAHKRNS